MDDFTYDTHCGEPEASAENMSEKIAAALPLVDTLEIFVSGPQLFTDSLSQNLQALGASSLIKTYSGKYR